MGPTTTQERKKKKPNQDAEPSLSPEAESFLEANPISAGKAMQIALEVASRQAEKRVVKGIYTKDYLALKFDAQEANATGMAEIIQAQWARIRDTLRTEFGEAEYSQWFKNVSVQRIEENRASSDPIRTIWLYVPTLKQQEYIQEHYWSHIFGLWHKIDPTVRAMGFVNSENAETQKSSAPDPIQHVARPQVEMGFTTARRLLDRSAKAYMALENELEREEIAALDAICSTENISRADFYSQVERDPFRLEKTASAKVRSAILRYFIVRAGLDVPQADFFAVGAHETIQVEAKRSRQPVTPTAPTIAHDIRHRAVIRDETDGTINVTDFYRESGIARQTIYTWHKEKKLIGWWLSIGGLVLPREQILGRKQIVSGIPEVSKVLDNGFAAWSFLSMESPYFDTPIRPIDALKAGRIEDVVRAAESYLENFA